jgi:transcriptional regulator with XRE-family HTH domain
MRLKTIYQKEYKVLLECVRTAREQVDLTQSQLANLMGTDQTAISKIEIGERRLDFIELRAICKALNIELQDFISDFETKLQKRTTLQSNG